MKNLIQSIDDVKLTKQNISQASSAITADLEAGFEDPFKLLTKIAFLEKSLEEAKKIAMKFALDEMKDQEITIAGAKLRMKEAGARYDFSASPNWVKVNESKKEIEVQQKEIEARLKTVKGSETVIDEESGEIYQIFQPGKKSTTTIEITFPKE